MRHPWLAVLLFAACGGSSKTSTMASASDKPAGPSCAQVSDNIVLMTSPEAKSAPTDAIDQIRVKIAKQCEDTGWSLAARTCVMKAKTGADTTACEPLFTEAQRNAWKPREPAETGDARTEVEGGGAAQPAAAAAPVPAPAPTVAPTALPPGKSRKPRPKGKAPGAAGDPCDGGE